MKNNVVNLANLEAERNWSEVAHALGEGFAKRANEFDQSNAFVGQNYEELRRHKLFSVAIPAELGGGGATYQELCSMVRELGKHCGSTGLAFAMHSHPVAVNVFKYLRDDKKAAKTLRKIATKELIIAGTGANDWLDSNGTTEKVDGGYRVNAHKRFVSGGPGADVFVTSAPFSSENGDEVLHFSIPFSAEGITVEDNWRTLGMRCTGSNDVEMKNVFVPDDAIIARRPAGEWHAMWDVILPVALPIIVSCYVGIADAAVTCAKQSAQRKSHLAPLLGELQNELVTAQLALDDMVRLCNDYQFTPSVQNTDAILTRKSIAARAVKTVVEKAADIVGGPGFFQGHPMERIVRDIRAVHFHPLPEKRQQLFSGRIALGLDPVKH